MPSARRVGLMKVHGERVVRRRDGMLRKYSTNFAAMISSVQRNVSEYLLSRHVSLVTVGEDERHKFGKL